MSHEQEHDGVEVSFAEVAGEDTEDALAHEAEAVEGVQDAGPEESDGVESDNDSPPVQPTLSSMLGIGPTGEGDDLAI